MTKQPNRTEVFRAQSRGDVYWYDPADLTLIDDPAHPLFDERVNLPVSERLVRSIMNEGIIEPIVIRRNGTSRKGLAIIEVVDGRQRVRATIEANRRLAEAGSDQPAIQVPAIVRKADDDRALTAMISANEIRRDDDVVTRAEKLARYLSRGYDEKAAKLAFGVSTRELQKLLAVIDMSPPLKQALRDRQVTMEIARTIAELPSQEQQDALASVLAGGGGKGRGEAAKLAAEKAAEKAGKRPKPKLKARPPKLVSMAVDNASCLPTGDYRRGVLDALDWVLGRKDVAWAAEHKK